MKPASINTYQNFKANIEGNQKSFMGRCADGISYMVDNTSKVTENFSDIVISTKNALSSPEEATIGILKDQIEDRVVNNDKIPNGFRRTAIYATALLVAVTTFIAANKTPEVIKNFTKNVLNKTKLGKNLLKGLSSVNRSVSNIANEFGLEPVKKLLGKINNFVADIIPQKVTNILRNTVAFLKLDKLKDWKAGDYIKTYIAAMLGYKTGKRFLNKHQEKLQNLDVKKVQVPQKEEEISDVDLNEAA